MATIATNVSAILQRCNTIITENLALATTVAALAAKVDALKAEVDQIKVNTDTPPTGDVVVSQDEIKALSDKLTSRTEAIKAFDESILKEK